MENEQVTFTRADAEELPFSSDSFDVVISHSVLHHLPNWRVIALEEIRRVLTANGMLLFYQPSRYNPPAVARRNILMANSRLILLNSHLFSLTISRM
ncbi:class I SAM-dependent methyltransferase [Haloarcula sp. CBA1122]|uniref:class I SAM-dependent methyltransferase n=1 Tax=Haloarcula sp. CBA1122 TaxID=2668069 RepID=UPI00352C44F3